MHRGNPAHDRFLAGPRIPHPHGAGRGCHGEQDAASDVHSAHRRDLGSAALHAWSCLTGPTAALHAPVTAFLLAQVFGHAVSTHPNSPLQGSAQSNTFMGLRLPSTAGTGVADGAGLVKPSSCCTTFVGAARGLRSELNPQKMDEIDPELEMYGSGCGLNVK